MSEKNQEYCNLATKICETRGIGLVTGISEYIASVFRIDSKPSSRLLEALHRTADSAHDIMEETPKNRISPEKSV